MNWTVVTPLVVAIFFGSFTAANYLAGRRERRLKACDATPRVKATINRDSYPGGWRSVQLHIIEPLDQQQFRYKDWYIERASLLRPSSARLARAQNDDYATGVFDKKNLVHTLQGKTKDRKQRFALEFFIRFPGDDLGKKAKFKVSYANASKRCRHSTKLWATVPIDAEPG